MGELSVASALGRYRDGSLAKEDLAREISGLPEEDLGDALLAVYAQMRGADEEEAARGEGSEQRRR